MASKRNSHRFPTPSESGEQIALFEWAEYQKGAYPILRWMFHVPNGGLRDIRTAAKLKAEGVKPGVPDIVLPAARGGAHGLYVEMKSREGKPTKEQLDFHDALRSEGYYVAICHSTDEAIQTILTYLKSPKTQGDAT